MIIMQFLKYDLCFNSSFSCPASQSPFRKQYFEWLLQFYILATLNFQKERKWTHLCPKMKSLSFIYRPQLSFSCRLTLQACIAYSLSKVYISSPLHMNSLVYLSRCDAKALEDSLCKRVIVTRDENIVKCLDPEAASLSRDALAKTVYTRLFDW